MSLQKFPSMRKATDFKHSISKKRSLSRLILKLCNLIFLSCLSPNQGHKSREILFLFLSCHKLNECKSQQKNLFWWKKFLFWSNLSKDCQINLKFNRVNFLLKSREKKTLFCCFPCWFSSFIWDFFFLLVVMEEEEVNLWLRWLSAFWKNF